MQITLPVILFTDIPPYEPSLQAILLSSGPILGLWNGQCKTQTADCRPGTKCRLRVKCRLQTRKKKETAH